MTGESKMTRKDQIETPQSNNSAEYKKVLEKETTHESRSSIELSKTSKGYNHKIKLYFSDNLEAENIVKQIEKLNKEMEAKFG